jgi:hypothetical protein
LSASAISSSIVRWRSGIRVSHLTHHRLVPREICRPTARTVMVVEVFGHVGADDLRVDDAACVRVMAVGRVVRDPRLGYLDDLTQRRRRWPVAGQVKPYL